MVQTDMVMLTGYVKTNKLDTHNYFLTGNLHIKDINMGVLFFIHKQSLTFQ